MAKYKLTPAAERDLEDIWHYTVGNWGVGQAVIYTKELDIVFGRLAENPKICHERSEFSPAVRILSHAHHLVVYIAAADGIVVVRVLHERMDLDKQLN